MSGSKSYLNTGMTQMRKKTKKIRGRVRTKIVSSWTNLIHPSALSAVLTMMAKTTMNTIDMMRK